MIKIYNEDCLETMSNGHIERESVDIVITSPPYNNSRPYSEYNMKSGNCRYSEYQDSKTNEEYCAWMVGIFNGYDRILKKDGVVLFNVSYGGENPNVMFDMLHSVCSQTKFMIADIICWKKSSAFPNDSTKNKLTRIWEPVFVMCREDEYKTFMCGKKVVSYSRTGQPFYSNMFNFIQAPNNDGQNEINKATFSKGLVIQLLEMYVPDKNGVVVYDSFMGTGTTAVACKDFGVDCIGSEISKPQCDFANDRINQTMRSLF